MLFFFSWARSFVTRSNPLIGRDFLLIWCLCVNPLQKAESQTIYLFNLKGPKEIFIRKTQKRDVGAIWWDWEIIVVVVS